MRKANFLRLSCSVFAALALLSLVMLALPVERGTVFWLVWLFTADALALCVFVVWTRVLNVRSQRSGLYGAAMLRICTVHLAAQLLLGLVFLLLGSRIKATTAALLLFLLLCVCVALLAAAEAARESVERIARRQAASMVNMKALTDRAESLAIRYEIGSLRRLAEDFYYSDPVSRPDLAGIEGELSVLLDRLERALKASGSSPAGTENAEAFIHSLSVTLEDRNRRCFRGKNTADRSGTKASAHL